jgi:hypothetical protein
MSISPVAHVASGFFHAVVTHLFCDIMKVATFRASASMLS